VASEVVGETEGERVVGTTLDREDGLLAGAGSVEVQPARTNRITAVLVMLNVLRILPT
jgi:hypothetical protein